jgi:hypothetical protein
MVKVTYKLVGPLLNKPVEGKGYKPLEKLEKTLALS